MRFTLEDLDPNFSVVLDKSLYYLRIDEQFQSKEDAMRAKARLIKMMENVRRDYPTVSYMIGASNTDGDTATKRYNRTNAPGRPAVIVEGIEKPQHIHIIAHGNMAPTFCNKVRNRLNSKHGARYAYSECIKNRNSTAIIYVYDQSYSTSTRGDFKFKDYIYVLKNERKLND